jgi:hypothetical protein
MISRLKWWLITLIIPLIAGFFIGTALMMVANKSAVLCLK